MVLGLGDGMCTRCAFISNSQLVSNNEFLQVRRTCYAIGTSTPGSLLCVSLLLHFVQKVPEKKTGVRYRNTCVFKARVVTNLTPALHDLLYSSAYTVREV